MITDYDIIQSIAKGDQRSFSLLYKKYADKVYNTALSYSKNLQGAEEITQDTFMKIHKNASTFQGNSSVSTWIYRIAINTSLNFLKKKNRFMLFKKSYKGSQTIDFEHPGVLMENQENSRALFRAIDCLPESQKTAFILSFIENLPRQEVADIMETSLKAVESLLQRSKKNMRTELEKLYPNRRN